MFSAELSEAVNEPSSVTHSLAPLPLNPESRRYTTTQCCRSNKYCSLVAIAFEMSTIEF